MTTPLARAGVSSLEERITQVGADLGKSLASLLAAVPGQPAGTMAVARALGIDKVLSSRVLKAVRSPDPIAFIHHVPGPEPLRRLLKAASARGVEKPLVSDAQVAVDAFEALIRNEVGDRGSLDAMITAWLPELRQPFELSRKQAAFKAMSQLRGSAAAMSMQVAIVQPSHDGRTLDVAWLYGAFGLQRLRPGVKVKFNNRRLSGKPVAERMATTLSGEPVQSPEGLHLEEFCTKPLPKLVTHGKDEAVQYVLADAPFDPRSLMDIVFADLTVREMRRWGVPGLKVKPFLFAEVAIPSKALVLDVFLADDVYPRAFPELHVYDTALEGLARVDDPVREVDRLDFLETIHPLGRGVDQCRLRQYPRYTALLHHVFDKLGWDPTRFRGFRCAIEYPIYGSQVAMAFEAPPAPSE